ncbi:uncharacterized protein LOC123445106 [Hordeum vulgare subsp. vulgare]|uniref:Uncharacterized protein n=1 Tax=Hordeum vulgare subsp. vulgare TaxID=112509 RepID=A0A8I6X596_HORVV|nr:uncharacterized protein LOC123445106 [Hordeum vulgare subsp. vulgare]KAI5019080.1 hypothetical protein ZWY2020_043968 [Hordeum vulgare]
MAMRVDSAILAVVIAFLLPLRLLSLFTRQNSSGSAGDLRRSCAALAIAAALLATFFALPRYDGGRTGQCAASVGSAWEEGVGREVRLEIEQLQLQLNRLESFWKNNAKAPDDKGDASEEYVEVVKAMGLDIQALIKEQEDIKESLWSSGSTINSVENEVRILAAESRKMNSDIYSVWSLANDTEKTVEALHSDVQKAQILMDESRKMNSNTHQIWSLAKDTAKKVESLYADVAKVQTVIDISKKMESNMHKAWSYAKQTEKRVEDIYSDVKKGFKKKGVNLPSWMKT